MIIMNKVTNFLQPTLVTTSIARRLFSSSPKLALAEGREKVVVLGSGWAGFNIALNMKKDIPLTVVSPSNHFLFTPLLASSAVGTLEFRCIQEPVRTVLGPEGRYIQASATSLDPVNRQLICQTSFDDVFKLDYDKLVISVGVKTNVSSI